MKKYIGIALAMLGCFLLGLASRRPPEVRIKLEEKIVYRDRVSVKDFMLQQNDRTTVVEQHPDGSSRTTIVDRGREERHFAHDKSSESVALRRLEKVESSGTDFSIGASVEKPMAGFLTAVPEYEIEFGRRILGSAWITGSFEPQRKGAGVGLRVEF